MPIEAVKIPQNVYVEDRIVGPLTLRQLMIVAIGGGGSYAIWSSLMKTFGKLDPVTTAIVWTPAVISLAFAFIRINDLSLMRLLLLRLEHMQKPSVRTWGPRTGISITVRTFTTADQKKNAPVTSAQLAAKRNKLEELKSSMNGGTEELEPLDIPDTPDDIAVSAVSIPAGSTGTPQPPASPPPPVDPNAISVSNATGAPVDGIRTRSSIYSTQDNG